MVDNTHDGTSRQVIRDLRKGFAFLGVLVCAGNGVFLSPVTDEDCNRIRIDIVFVGKSVLLREIQKILLTRTNHVIVVVDMIPHDALMLGSHTALSDEQFRQLALLLVQFRQHQFHRLAIRRRVLYLAAQQIHTCLADVEDLLCDLISLRLRCIGFQYFLGERCYVDAGLIRFFFFLAVLELRGCGFLCLCRHIETHEEILLVQAQQLDIQSFLRHYLMRASGIGFGFCANHDVLQRINRLVFLHKIRRTEHVRSKLRIWSHLFFLHCVCEVQSQHGLRRVIDQRRFILFDDRCLHRANHHHSYEYKK